MPTHKEDIHIILDIQQTIKQTLTTYSTHFPILIWDFNRDVIPIERHHEHSLIQPTNKDKEWLMFTSNFQFTPIPNKSTFWRQGEPNHNHASLIDIFYTPNSQSPIHNYTSIRATSMLTLHLPTQFAIHKPPTLPTNTTLQFTCPIPETNIQVLLTKFNELSLLTSTTYHITTSSHSSHPLKINKTTQKYYSL